MIYSPPTRLLQHTTGCKSGLLTALNANWMTHLREQNTHETAQHSAVRGDAVLEATAPKVAAVVLRQVALAPRERIEQMQETNTTILICVCIYIYVASAFVLLIIPCMQTSDWSAGYNPPH